MRKHLGHKEKITLKAAIQQFALSKIGTLNHRGLTARIRVVTRLMAFNRTLDEVTSHDQERLKRDRMAEGSSGQTIRHNLNLIRSAWKYAKLGCFAGLDDRVNRGKVSVPANHNRSLLY